MPAPTSSPSPRRRAFAVAVGGLMMLFGWFVGVVDWFWAARMSFGHVSPAITAAVVAGAALCLAAGDARRFGAAQAGLYGLGLVLKPMLRPRSPALFAEDHLWFMLPGLALVAFAGLLARRGNHRDA